MPYTKILPQLGQLFKQQCCSSSPFSDPTYPLSASPEQPALCVSWTEHGRGHSTEPVTAASIGTATSNVLARWPRRQHYIRVMHRDIPERLPMMWLRAAQFQRPKQRELRRFPLMLSYATLFHFLQSFCQWSMTQTRFPLAVLSNKQMTCGYVIQLGFHLEEDGTLPTVKWLTLIGTNFFLHHSVLMSWLHLTEYIFHVLALPTYWKLAIHMLGITPGMYDLITFHKFWVSVCFAVVPSV